MTNYDYIVIAFYLGFMFLLGPIYKSFSKTSSDFFRGGGGMLWWVVGSSAFMTTFTAWAFTGGAAKAYETGTFFLVLFACNIAALIFCYLFVVAKYRQMRIITVVEGVRKRFGRTSEQMLAWFLIAMKILYGGGMLYTIAVFMASVFDGVSMPFLIILLGAIITLMTVLGGSWSATAGDFVQMIVVVMITVIMGVLTLVKVGGIGTFLESIPSRHLDWTEFDRPVILVVFILTLCVNQLTQMNSMMEGAARFIFVKDAHAAKKAILIQIVGFVLLPIIWIVPPMMAAVWYPDMAAKFPGLNNPNEAAYVVMAMDLLPAGLFGLLVCAIFAATVTSLNSQLNIVGGSFVRNLYIQVFRPQASENEQIKAGRIFMLLYGVVWILLGLCFQKVEGIELFDLLLWISAATGLPLAVPLFLGIFYKKTPPWAGWSAMIAGFVPAAICGLLFKVDQVVQFLSQNPDLTTNDVAMKIWMIFGGSPDLNSRELGDLKLAITTGLVVVFSMGWFYFTRVFYRKDEQPYVAQVDQFFEDMATPIQPEEHELGGHDNESRQCSVLGNLCLVYGVFISLLVFIPNAVSGRLIIFCCGAFITGVGVILRILSERKKVKVVSAEE